MDSKHVPYIFSTVFYLLWIYLKTYTNNSLLKQASEEEMERTSAVHDKVFVPPVAFIGAVVHLVTLRYNNLWLVCAVFVYPILMIVLEFGNAYYALANFSIAPSLAFVVDITFLSALVVCQQMAIDCLYAVIKLRMKDAVETKKRNSAERIMSI